MNCRIGLSYRYNVVVAHGATTGNAGMIKGAVPRQFEKVSGVVTVIAFDGGRYMEFGFADGQYTVMAFAAICKYFSMIDKGNNGKSLWCMTGLARITGREVNWRFPWNLAGPRHNI